MQQNYIPLKRHLIAERGWSLLSQKELSQKEIEGLLSENRVLIREVNDDKIELLRIEIKSLLKRYPDEENLLKIKKCITKDNVTIVDETENQVNFNVKVLTNDSGVLYDTFAFSVFKG